MDSEHTAPTERLWTPWRMKYVGGHAKEDGCIFCNRIAETQDISSLVLYRGQHVFAIMNLYPYNTGHIMLVPNQHASDPSELPAAAWEEMGTTLPLLTNTLRCVFGCDGFNVGLNIGSVAGAGVAAHLHQHIVPRWIGDANFMPVMASTMVLPELIPVTYAKIRAEIEHELTGADFATLVLVDRTGQAVLIHNGILPQVHLEPDVPVWKSVMDAVPAGVAEVELAGWAGQESAMSPDAGTIGLTLRGIVPENLTEGWQLTSIDDNLDAAMRATIERAVAQIAPRI